MTLGRMSSPFRAMPLNGCLFLILFLSDERSLPRSDELEHDLVHDSRV